MSSRPPTESPRGERPWLDSWVSMTTWWMEPAARAGAQMLSYGPERILVEIVDGMVQRFGDGSIEFSARGWSGRAHLDWLRLITRKGRHEAYLQLSDVEFGGFAFDHLAAVVDSVQIISGRQPRLTLDDVRISGRAPLAAVAGWISDRSADWAIAVDGGGAVLARHRARDVTEVELTVDHDRVEMELRALRWRRHRRARPVVASAEAYGHDARAGPRRHRRGSPSPRPVRRIRPGRGFDRPDVRAGPAARSDSPGRVHTDPVTRDGVE